MILSAKTGFERRKIIFCVLEHLLGSFSHPGANVALDNGVFGVLSSIFPFFVLLEPIFVFRVKMHLWRQNSFLELKAVLSPKSAFLAFWQPASQTASQPTSQPASQPASQTASQPASQPACKPASQQASQPAKQAGRQASKQAGSQAGRAGQAGR